MCVYNPHRFPSAPSPHCDITRLEDETGGAYILDISTGRGTEKKKNCNRCLVRVPTLVISVHHIESRLYFKIDFTEMSII